MKVDKKIEALIAELSDDHELVEAIGALGWRAARLVHSWGPVLYRRNRAVFLPLIERWSSPWSLRSSSNLEPWIAEVEANRDFRLYRSLYHAQLMRSRSRTPIQVRWQNELVASLREAPDRSTRREEIDKRDLSFEIDDELAVLLYEIDPELTGEWLLRRIDRSSWWEIEYEKTAELARSRGDHELYDELYRKTFSPRTWSKDVLRLAGEVTDPTELDRELDRRHLDSNQHTVDIKTLVKLFEQRGADVVPYLERHVADIRSWSETKAWKALATMAREAGWASLWATVVRSQFREAEFSAEVVRLCEDPAPAWERAPQLLAIAGAKSGWGSWRWFTKLSPKAALTLYDSFALLCRSAFAQHLRIDSHTPYSKLAGRALEAGDTDMFDLLAARAAVVRSWRPQKLTSYARHYNKLEPDEFARRATRVLDQIEPPRPRGSGRLGTNALHTLLFSDPGRYAPAIARARDLLEASYEPSRHIALQMIARSTDAELAVANIDHLTAYLLDEARRETRIAAFECLALAARHSREIAETILGHARAALDLRRKRYPRDRLIRLVGRILAAWPELRGPREQPTIYQKAVAPW